jgi:Ca2+-binding EF-hand superfamily protein
MKKLLMISVLAMSIAVPAAMAKDMEAKADMMFSKIDTNGDGMISKDEHKSFGDKMFTDTDTNSDGNISMDEMKAMKMKEHAEMKKEMPEKHM